MIKSFRNPVLNYLPVKLSKSKPLSPNFLNIPLYLSNPDHSTLIRGYHPINPLISYQGQNRTSGKTDLQY